MKQIAITGAQGLIGSGLIESLPRNSYKIVPIDIRYTEGLNENIDINDYESIRKAIADCVGVVHLAAVSRVVWGEIEPGLCHKTNVEGTKNVIRACLSSPQKPWLIYASSREVYGQQPTLPITENAKFAPLNHYARSKCLAEDFIFAAQESGLKASIVRFSGVFGGLYDHYNRVIPAFCTNALSNRDLHVEGSDCLFDFTYIDDVIAGLTKIISLLDTNKESLPPIHFTTCQPASLMEIAELIINITKSSSDIKIKPHRTYDVGRFYGDFSRARSLLGWRPNYSLVKGLEKFAREIKDSKNQPNPVIKRGFNENLESYTWLPAAL